METWLTFALLGAVAAAFTNIFAKIGMEGIDSTLATAIRAMVGAVYLCAVATYFQKWPHVKSLNPKAMLMIVLAGLAGSTSWLCMYRALVDGPASKVTAIDKLSVPLAVIMAVLLLKERLLAWNWLGVALIVLGVYLVAYKPKAI
jgi:bacterial/archaeal transporter family protein